MTHMDLHEIEKPLVIDAIICRLETTVEIAGVGNYSMLPNNEAAFIAKILAAARHCVREWQPNKDEKARGAGTGVGMRAAEDALIRVVKADL